MISDFIVQIYILDVQKAYERNLNMNVIPTITVHNIYFSILVIFIQ